MIALTWLGLALALAPGLALMAYYGWRQDRVATVYTFALTAGAVAWAFTLGWLVSR
jgi:hypothetical protein